MSNSDDVIEIDNHLIFNTLQNFFISENFIFLSIKNSEYDQEIAQSKTTDNPMAPRGRATQPSWDTRKTN